MREHTIYDLRLTIFGSYVVRRQSYVEGGRPW